MYNPRLVWNRSAKRFGRSQKGLEAIGIPGGGYINNYLDYVTRQAVFDACKTIDVVGSTVLDVGCGIGRLTIHYAKNAKFLIGLDISEEMIRIAKERTKLFGHKVEYVVASAHAMPFKQDIFDIINCVAVLQHVEDDKLFDRSIQEISRVLRSHGYAILVENAPLRIKLFENKVSELGSIVLKARPVTYILSRLEPNNLSLVSKRGVNTSLIIDLFLKVALIFKPHSGRSETSYSRKTGFLVVRLAFDVMTVFLALSSIVVDAVISRVTPVFFYDHSKYKTFLLSKIDKPV